jgi:hydrogenase expression/formation protein HypC
MCLAVPAKVVRIEGQTALVELGGLIREANTMLVPGLCQGDYVLLHAGFAIQTLDEVQARETLELLALVAQEERAET